MQFSVKTLIRPGREQPFNFYVMWHDLAVPPFQLPVCPMFSLAQCFYLSPVSLLFVSVCVWAPHCTLQSGPITKPPVSSRLPRPIPQSTPVVLLFTSVFTRSSVHILSLQPHWKAKLWFLWLEIILTRCLSCASGFLVPEFWRALFICLIWFCPVSTCLSSSHCLPACSLRFTNWIHLPHSLLLHQEFIFDSPFTTASVSTSESSQPQTLTAILRPPQTGA